MVTRHLPSPFLPPPGPPLIDPWPGPIRRTRRGASTATTRLLRFGSFIRALLLTKKEKSITYWFEMRKENFF